MTDPDDSPGLPWFRTWRSVYWFAIGCFAAYIVLLTMLTHLFP